MQSEQKINDAITLGNDGAHVGQFGQFVLRSAFQPIFSVEDDTLKIIAHEGLVRPEIANRTTPPGDLFAHQNSSERLFLDQLCRTLHIRNFPQISTANAFLFLNLNPAMFDSRQVIERDVEMMLKEAQLTALPPSSLVCEIIENDVPDQANIDMLCSELRDRGFGVAIDDFGVNSSNWQRFSRIRPQILKLDGVVFRNLCKSLFATRALRTLTTRLRDIGCTLLVEGVETSLQFDIALNAGITLLQGYYLAEPDTMPFPSKHNLMSFPSETASFLQTQQLATG